MALLDIFSPAGGLSYQLIARKRAHKSWAPFRATVKDWISNWRSSWSENETELIIFGPSAGWTLPLESFRDLKKLTFVEPDPLARWILKRRCRNAAIHFEIEYLDDKTILPWFDDTRGSRLKSFVQARPHAAFLFSNVLGQVPLLVSKSVADDKTLKAHFFEALEKRSWASYHDIYSSSTPSEVTDHETQWLAENREIKKANWPISEKQMHVIGFVQESSREGRRPNKATR